MARGYGSSSLPAHYQRRSRGRHLPSMAGHKIVRGHYRHNPGKGINWMPILLIGGAALLFMRPGGLGFGGMGTSVLPPGYTYLGSGFYRGPDGQTYYRSPTTGQMSPATAQQVASGAVQQITTSAVTAAVPAITQGITSLFGSLVRSIGGAFQDTQAPVVGTPVGVTEGDVYGTGASAGGYSDILRSGGEVGYVPAPLPDFWAESSV